MSDERRERPNMTATDVANAKYQGPVPGDALLKHLAHHRRNARNDYIPIHPVVPITYWTDTGA